MSANHQMGSKDHLELKDTKEPLTKNQNAESDALESVLYHVGDMGKYQKMLFLGMFPFGFFFAFIYFVQMFITVTPQRHWCLVPELQHLDISLRRNLSAPGAVNGNDWDRCQVYAANWTRVLETMMPPSADTPLIPCTSGWEFELTDIPYHTVVSEREWVCEKSSYAPTAQAFFFAGAFVGGIFFGWLADNFGRVPALIGANVIGSVGGIATIFTTGLWDFVFCRFLVGMAFDNCFIVFYILVLEYVGSKHRTWVANLSIALFFGSGCITLPWLAFWISDWRKLLWVTALPMLLVVFSPFVVPESARWLVIRGRVNQAVDVLRKFERINGTKIPEDVMDDFIVSTQQSKKEKETMMDVFRSAPLRMTMIIITVVYMSSAVIFDGLVRLSDAFGLDFFITFTVTSATEIPSVVMLAIVLDRWGRRILTCGSMAVSGVLIVIATLFPKGVVQAGFAILARFFINMSYSAVTQWVMELMPTGVRASGSSMLHMSGYVATVLSPFIVYSERLWSVLPLVILGGVALVGSSIGVLLPETKGREMPQTMADGERIVREHSLCGKPESDDLEIVEKNNEKGTSLIL